MCLYDVCSLILTKPHTNQIVQLTYEHLKTHLSLLKKKTIHIVFSQSPTCHNLQYSYVAPRQGLGHATLEEGHNNFYFI